MLKMTGLASTGVLLLLFANQQSSPFSKYKTAEAYEIRPGILMMPRYSNSGQVCEIGLQVRHYSPEIVRLDSTLSRKEIDQIFDEIVPDNERGARSKGLTGDLITESGPTMVESIDFENVLIQIHSQVLSASRRTVHVRDAVVAIAQWKNRKCQ
jgi:hypothetical protein